jgi:hypothetical protein
MLEKTNKNDKILNDENIPNKISGQNLLDATNKRIELDNINEDFDNNSDIDDLDN